MGYEWTDIGTERPVVGPDDAEEYAAEVLRAIGFSDAERTPTGPDEGIDVLGTGVVGQVKHQTNQVGRPDLQRLVGAAPSDAYRVFFSLNGYSQPAVAFGDTMGVALLVYSQMGHVAAGNGAGHELLDMSRMSPTERDEVVQSRHAQATDADIPDRNILLDQMEAVVGRFRRAVAEMTRLDGIARPTREEKRLKRKAKAMAMNYATIGYQLEETMEAVEQLRRSRFRTKFGLMRHVEKLRVEVRKYEVIVSRWEKTLGL